MASRAERSVNKQLHDQKSVESSDGMMDWDLRTGRWEEALADVEMVDAVITDPPYSARTHEGHDAGAELANRAGKGWTRSDGGVDVFRPRREISYTSWGVDEVFAFVKAWAPRNRGWFVCLSDSELCGAWRQAFEAHGLTGFHPLPIVIPGMTVRMSGDGPSSWAIYANVARPKALCRWGTNPGAYQGNQGEREHIGGKPLWAMRALVRDYSKPGNIICDPCAGGGTTLLAALMEGRHAIGSEVDESTATLALERISKGYTPDIFSTTKAAKRCEKCGNKYRIEAFAKDRTAPMGRQSWCRRCKAEWEHGPENTYGRLRAWLDKNEPKSVEKWTQAIYLKMHEQAGGNCETCGAGLRYWQGTGHNLDRISNDGAHTPENCRLVCWPCNKKKSNSSPLAADQEIQMWVDKWGRGRVPWDQIQREEEWTRFELPDLSDHLVESAPNIEQLGLFKAAK